MKKLLIKTSHPQSILAYRYAIGSVAVVLYLLGWVALLWMLSYVLKVQWYEAVPFTIELKESATESQIFQYQRKLESEVYAKPESVHYVSKEAGIKALQHDLGRDSILLFGENPLPNMLQFQLKGGYFEQADSIITNLKKEELVAQVFYDEYLIKAAVNLGYWSWGLLFLALVVIGGAVLLVRQALRWVLWSNRSIIKTMRLAGASPAVQRYPYNRQSWINGAWSGAIAVVLLILTAIAIRAAWGEGLNWWGWWQFWLILICIPLVGMLLWAWTISSTAKKYIGNY